MDILKVSFKMNDFKIIKYFLWIEIVRNESEIIISQIKYALKLIHGAGLIGANLVRTATKVNNRLTSNNYDKINK